MISETNTNTGNRIKHELEKAFVHLRHDGIIQIELKLINDLNIDDMKEIFAAVKEVANAKKFPTLIISKGYINIEKETREYFREEGNLYTIADAFIIDSIGLKMIANFYLKFEKPVNPSKMFNNVDDALKWLSNYLT
ncbi:MAG: DUF7793 family protein [Bacteroidia bacterium]